MADDGRARAGRGPVARGLGVAAGLDPEIAAELARRCAGYGYLSLWSNDHPMGSGLDADAAFAEAAPDLDIGVAVLPLDRHEPEAIAAKVSALGLDPSRLWIGIGAGFTKRPLGVVKEGLAALRDALPQGARVAVAAMGPKMCALAGAEADGVFLNWMTPERAVTPLPRSSGTCASRSGLVRESGSSKRSPSTASSTRDTSATSNRSTSRRGPSGSPRAIRPRSTSN